LATKPKSPSLSIIKSWNLRTIFYFSLVSNEVLNVLLQHLLFNLFVHQYLLVLLIIVQEYHKVTARQTSSPVKWCYDKPQSVGIKRKRELGHGWGYASIRSHSWASPRERSTSRLSTSDVEGVSGHRTSPSANHWPSGTWGSKQYNN